MVANGTNKPSIEVGIIGREGMTGLAVVLGSDRAQHATYIQLAGMGCASARTTCGKPTSAAPPCIAPCCASSHAFLAQTTTTALANGRSKMEERLARWLLMADDRIDGEELPLTHEFLGLMLGTHRPGVTIAVQALEKAGLIATRRGQHHHPQSQSAWRRRSNGTYVRSGD